MDEENNEVPNKSIDMDSNRIEDIKENFIFLTDEELSRLFNVVANDVKDSENPGIAFDRLDKYELKKYLKDANIEPP